MLEPIRTIEITGGRAFVYENETRYEDKEGETIAVVPFAVDVRLAEPVFQIWRLAYDRGFKLGYKAGRREIIDLAHELLGIEKVISALEINARGSRP